jgi:hypothetical protein
MGHLELLVHWKGLPAVDATWVPLQEFKELYHSFQLEDELILQREGECDRTTSKTRGLSPNIISGDSRRNENAQTHTHKHTIPNMKFKLKLLQIKWHVLGFTKDIA